MKIRLEAMAVLWEGDNPERAAAAAHLISPLYEDVKPGQPLVTMRQGGQLYLAYVTEYEPDEPAVTS